LLPAQGEPQLYNLKNDPGEKDNIASKHPDVVARSRKAIQDWETTVSNPRQYGMSLR
jgi:hypothetical protein